MTDWTKEEDEAFNEVERQSNLGKQILRDRMNKSSGMDCCTYDCIQGRDCPVRKSKWVGLTDQEIDNLWNQHEPRFDYYLFSCDIEAKLKEKNT